MSVSPVDQVLAQMRVMSAQASGAPSTTPAAGLPSFSDLLTQSVGQINETQQTAGALKEAFVLGDDSVNLAEVMIASQKASLSFEAAVQVRNKLIDAYKEVMSMPI